MKILVVYWHPPGSPMRSAVKHHLRALERVISRDELVYHNAFDPFPGATRRRRYRAVVLHNTLLCMRWTDTFANYAARTSWIEGLRCPKLAIPQDEYDHHEILDEWLASLGVTHVFSNFGETERRALYPILHDRVAFEEVLTGYVDEETLAWADAVRKPTAERRFDLVYRASSLPYWFGRQGQLKATIGEKLGREAERAGFVANVSSREADTLYGHAWLHLLLAGKAIAGCETGSRVLDHRGEIQSSIRTMLARAPQLGFEEVSARMPTGWDSHAFLAIGPRHLEAAATRTCQLLVEGRYDDILEPETHYIPVPADLEDLDAVIDCLGDSKRLSRIAERAYEDVCLSGRFSYDVFGATLARAAGRDLPSLRTQTHTQRAAANWNPLNPPESVGSQTGRGLRHLRAANVKTAQRKVLFLADDHRGHTGNLLAHINAYRKYSHHHISLFNPRGVPSSRFLDLGEFDAVIVHYSLVLLSDSYVGGFLRDSLAAFDGLKVQFLQDEYRWVDEMTECMRRVAIDVLFSLVPESEIPQVYGERLPGTIIVPTLAGFVPDSLVGRSSPALTDRPIDIGYRGRTLPYWLGVLAQEKTEIGAGVLARAASSGLQFDISSSENERIYGRSWERFICSCKSMLGTESGASITDFDGAAEHATLSYLTEHPHASFAEVHDAVLRPYEGNAVIKVPSPRIFETAAFRTAMILFAGEYGGIVRPGEHYLALEKDFSNMPEVVEALGDHRSLTEMTERTYADIIASGRYSLRNEVATLDSIVDELAMPRARGRSVRFRLAKVERPLTTGVLSRFDLRQGLRAIVWATAVMRFALGEERFRRILRAYMVDAAVRGSANPRRLASDILRLGLILRAYSGRPLTSPFWIEVRIEPESERVILISTGRRGRANRAVAPDELTSAGLTRTLLWDHRSLGGVVYYRFLGRGFGLAVGYHGQGGLCHLSALESIAGVRPDLIADALEPLAARPGRVHAYGRAFHLLAAVLPTRTTRRLIRRRVLRARRRRPAVAVALLRSPRNYLGKAFLAIRALAGDSTLRRVARHGLRDPGVRAAGGVSGLLEDIVKLDVLNRARAGRYEEIAAVWLVQDGSQLTFVSTAEITDGGPGEGEPILRARVPSRVVWDNRPVGPILRVPVRLHRGLLLGFEPSGAHEFRALEALFARSPAVVWDAIRPETR